jgi:hypothetical protein
VPQRLGHSAWTIAMSPPVHSSDMLVSSETNTDIINNNNNNNDDDGLCDKPALSTEELALLAKLEEANR